MPRSARITVNMEGVHPYGGEAICDQGPLTKSERRALVRLDVRTTNPLNGGTGHSRLAGIIASKERRRLRSMALQQCEFQVTVGQIGGIGTGDYLKPCTVTLTRIAPRPLDGDGWQSAAKPIRDGVADFLGVKDNDPRVTWNYAQRKGRVRECAVEIEIARLQPAPERHTTPVHQPAAQAGGK